MYWSRSKQIAAGFIAAALLTFVFFHEFAVEACKHPLVDFFLFYTAWQALDTLFDMPTTCNHHEEYFTHDTRL